MNRERLKETLRKAEGFSQPYFDVSQWSGGYGHRLPASFPIKQNGAAETGTITKEQAEDWLDEDINIATHAVDVIFDLPEDTTDSQHEALIEMAYNLGQSRLSKFVKMICAVNEGNWVEAGNEARNSKWYSQVGDRAKRIVKMIQGVQVPPLVQFLSDSISEKPS